jgi:hypothetical protein
MVASYGISRSLTALLVVAFLAPIAGAQALAARRAPEPVCADRSGARGYTGPSFGLIGDAPLAACVRDELPPQD